MSTQTPSELLNLWKQEQMTAEMAIGHILQNLVKQQAALEALLMTQNKLSMNMNRLMVIIDAKHADTNGARLR
ncbi:MAG: hypothetical protein U0350_16540 [Caldilineaceae bacterium]